MFPKRFLKVSFWNTNMARINSQRKGKRFEREITKKLSKLTGLTFKRVPMSGGFGTMGAKRREFRGDIYCENENSYWAKHVVIECKITKKKISLSDLFFDKSSILAKWVKQAHKEAHPMQWVLIFRDGTRKTYVAAMETEFFNENFKELYKNALKYIISKEHVYFAGFHLGKEDPPRYLHIWRLKDTSKNGKNTSNRKKTDK